MTINLIFVVSILALVFSFMTCLFSIKAYATVIGLQNSTHKIQYMPAPLPQEPEMDEKTGQPLTDKQVHENTLEQIQKMYPDD